MSEHAAKRRRTRMSMLELIASTAPERPACFDSHPDWLAWLAAAHLSGVRVLVRGHRRIDRDKVRVAPAERIDICEDCTKAQQSRMTAAGRCRQT